MVNIATGKIASQSTSVYLTGTLLRGAELRKKFQSECSTDDTRLLKTLKRVKVQNFAFENLKRPASKQTKALHAAEGVRDAFGHLLVKIFSEHKNIDLREILSYPITQVPLALSHSDGSLMKTEKAGLTKLLESKYSSHKTDLPSDHSSNQTILFDGGLLLHEVLPYHNNSTYGKIVSELVIRICSVKEKFIHLLLDKYIEPSIKDLERLKRGADTGDQDLYLIRGSDQKQRKKGTQLLKSGTFKEELARFMLTEIRSEYYATIIGDKTLYVSHGGYCIKLYVDNKGILVVEEPAEFQGKHEEADTLIAFHASKITGNLLVRSSDTDVFVILIGLVPKLAYDSVVLLDYGSGNNRRLIPITKIHHDLEGAQVGLSEALIGFHALPGLYLGIL